MLISRALGSFGSGYDLIFVAACWVLWSWLHVVGSLALAQGKKMSSLRLFFIIFVSYSATDKMFGALICFGPKSWSR